MLSLLLLLSVGVASADQGTAPGNTAVSNHIVNLFIAPDWIAETDLGGTLFGASIASARDIIVGISWYDGGQGNEGWAVVYHDQKDAEHVNFVPMIFNK